MSHYEERLERDLKEIGRDLASISKLVEEALRNAIHALLSGNREQAYQCVLNDLPINRAVRRLDKTCLAFIATHLPTAGPLRWVSSVMRMNIALERIGDYAATICRQTVQLPYAPKDTLGLKLEAMSKEARQMLHQAMEAFTDLNAEAAKATMGIAYQLDTAFETVFEELIEADGQWSDRDVFALLVIFHTLERVSDQAKNICEETVFAATGEGKAPKTYRILFLDEDNAGVGKLAEAIGRKTYPSHMSFDSAGRTATSRLDPVMFELAIGRGMDLAGETPVALEPIEAELRDYHVIISFAGPVSGYMPRVPFHTVALEWDVGSPPAPDAPDAPDAKERWDAIHRALAVRLRDLVELMHGEEVE